jgi:hypothetical protein
VAEPANQRPGPPSQNRVSLRPSPPPADVVDLIMADHRRILRLGDALHGTARWNGDSRRDLTLADVWQRLAGLLETHTRAEEEICYLPMSGSGQQSAERRGGETIADHDDIREAIGEASLCLAGSDPWWRAVRAVIAVTADHLHREECGMLADCLPRLTIRQRFELGSQWCAFVAAWSLDAAPPPRGRSRPSGTYLSLPTRQTGITLLPVVCECLCPGARLQAVVERGVPAAGALAAHRRGQGTA